MNDSIRVPSAVTASRTVRRVPGIAVLSLLAIVAVDAGACGGGSARRVTDTTPPPASTEAVAAPGGDATLFVVHSWTGHTEAVARELAAMLGARIVVIGESFDPGVPDEGPRLADVLPTISLAGVQRVYLGSPIWAEAPTPQISALVDALDLHGVGVVYLYTYLHFVKPEAVEALAARVRGRGGTWLPPLAIHAPVLLPPRELVRRAARTFLSRPDLRGEEPVPQPACVTAPPRRDGRVCRVGAGDTWLGDDDSPDAPAGAPPPRRMHVDAFAIDEAEVTLRDYRRCLDAGACPALALAGSECERLAADGDDRPAPCIGVEQARAFCTWAGMRLPTEVEWTRAARGATLRPYPWGDEAPGRSPRGNFGEPPSRALPSYAVVPADRPWADDGFAALAPPCRYGAGRSLFGVCDMAGNLDEWVDAPDGATFKGGSWLDGDPEAFRVAARAMVVLGHAVARGMGSYLTGARCAMTTSD